MMRLSGVRRFLTVVSVAFVVETAFARQEELLRFSDGRAVETPAAWRERRAEILRLFESEMYGTMPPKPATMVTELQDEKVTMSGFAIRRRVRMYFREDKSGPFIDWLVVRPRHAKGATPVILFLNSIGALQLLPDKDLTFADGYLACSSNPTNVLRSANSNRGQWCDPNNRNCWPVVNILARGYSIMTACYYDISPDPGKKEDRATKWRRRCFDLWPADLDTHALMAWAWGLCRGLDLAEREPGIDAKRAVVTGCSRLGKAALLAGAYDERFAVVAPNQTGKGGAPLTRTPGGENIGTEKKSFPHWYKESYLAYAGRDAEIPYDQDLLLACVAPRRLLVTGFDETWFNTKAEFLACQGASPAWEFLGKPGLPKVSFPADYETSAIGSHLGYVRRSENHGLSPYDWKWILDFADRAWTDAAPAPFPTWSEPRRVTEGPHEHFLASYFAIDSWSPNKRYLLALETDINGRLPEANERCTLGLVDLEDGNRFIPVTTTACWNFQEAAMAFWMSDDEILFNDVRDGKFSAVILNWKTKAERVLPRPVSAVSEDRTWAVSINYARLYLLRPDYGYAGPGQDPLETTPWPTDDGLWTMDLKTGETKLILSVAATRGLVPQPKVVKGKPGQPLAYHCHTVISKDGAKIFFLARSVDWFDKVTHKIPHWETTSFTVNRDGTDLRRCFKDGWEGSHFNWAPDGSHKMLVTAAWNGHLKSNQPDRAFGLVEFEVGKEDQVRHIGAGILDADWHCVYSPDGKFMSGETYWNRYGQRPWVLVRLADGMSMPMGSFFVPEKYRGTYWRCDLHARYRPDGRQIAFNSVHEGTRQIYVRDITPPTVDAGRSGIGPYRRW